MMHQIISETLDPDDLLMRQVQRGDHLALEGLIKKYQRQVIALLSRTLNDPAEAEDLAQNVFLRVYLHAENFHFSAKFSTWLYTIARNLGLNELRRRSRHQFNPLTNEAADSEHHSQPQFEDKRQRLASEELLHTELQQKVAEALAALPEDQRLAMVLFQEEDRSYREIASVLGISLGATKSLMHRGRQALKQKLLPYIRTGSWPNRRVTLACG